MAKDFVTIQEAAEYLGKSSQTIRRMIKRGDLEAKRINTPQGFHYVIARDDVTMNGFIKRSSPSKTTPKKILHKTTVEKPIQADSIEAKETLTNQNLIPTSQNSEEPINKATIPPIDSNELIKVLDRHHKENVLLFRVIEKLQSELDRERRRPKSFIAYFFDWLSHKH
ncbi:MAG: excisionase family DNA binding protein [Oceanicoccus sp.]|jgi:excisionase family DNA binding protein